MFFTEALDIFTKSAQPKDSWIFLNFVIHRIQNFRSFWKIKWKFHLFNWSFEWNDKFVLASKSNLYILYEFSLIPSAYFRHWPMSDTSFCNVSLKSVSRLVHWSPLLALSPKSPGSKPKQLRKEDQKLQFSKAFRNQNNFFTNSIWN
jgi:hypothetical protein